MTQYLIMCRSLTDAQRSQRILERAGIAAALVKAPQGLNTMGCGYALSIRKQVKEAADIVGRNKLLKGKIFWRRDGQDFQEVKR